jgi:hypothetical protein
MKQLTFIMLIAIAVFSTSCETDQGGNADMRTIDFIVQSSEWVEYGIQANRGFLCLYISIMILIRVVLFTR